MGTDAHVVVHGEQHLAVLAEQEIHRLERRWSRFLADSEVSALNASAGSWQEVSAETFDLVRRALDGHRITAGRFDPTVLGAVVRAGYDRSFDELDDPDAPATSPSAAGLRGGADQIALDPERRAVRLPAGVGFDPGGIAKGLAADRVTATIDRAGAAGVLVNLGGDLRMRGIGPDGDDWTVAIDPAATGTPMATLALASGAVATSTTRRRRWTRDSEPRHHLIDPRTGTPSDDAAAHGGLVAATVVARTGWQAEVLAKAALLGGRHDGAALVTALGADALLVDEHGDLHPTPGLARFCIDPPHPHPPVPHPTEVSA
jgi:thiamine biosynthesis lipoprotein